MTNYYIIGIEEVEVAPPKAHEVRIKILYTGVYVSFYLFLIHVIPKYIHIKKN